MQSEKAAVSSRVHGASDAPHCCERVWCCYPGTEDCREMVEIVAPKSFLGGLGLFGHHHEMCFPAAGACSQRTMLCPDYSVFLPHFENNHFSLQFCTNLSGFTDGKTSPSLAVHTWGSSLLPFLPQSLAACAALLDVCAETPFLPVWLPAAGTERVTSFLHLEVAGNLSLLLFLHSALTNGSVLGCGCGVTPPSQDSLGHGAPGPWTATSAGGRGEQGQCMAPCILHIFDVFVFHRRERSVLLSSARTRMLSSAAGVTCSCSIHLFCCQQKIDAVWKLLSSILQG